jgi:SAM-dependent methyltransferase
LPSAGAVRQDVWSAEELHRVAAETLKIPRQFSRSAKTDEEWARRSALWQLGFVRDRLGLPDLADVAVLDVGCGVKLTAALIEEDIPIGRYVGVDVYREMIEFLDAEVEDPRFGYHHVEFHNELYNPDGTPMTSASRLPVEENAFDVIWLFSVFTHLAPHDFRTMLRVLRPHARDDGRLLFSLYLDEVTPGGHGFTDAVHQKLALNGATPAPTLDGFMDVFPEHPLRVALYSRRLALELIADTGWDVVEVNDPGPFIQHSIVCAPA